MTATPAPAARMLHAADVARILGVSRMTVSREIYRGNLRAYRVGRSLLVRSDDLARYMQGAEVGAA